MAARTGVMRANRLQPPWVWPCALAALLAGQAANAQFAVVDTASLAQLVQEARTLVQQLQTARAQLTQTQSLYQSVTGNRGLQHLLDGAGASTVPDDWTALLAAMQATGSYRALAADIGSALTANAVLSTGQLAALTPAEQVQVGARRRAVALLQGLAQQALDDNAGRVAELRQLIGAIASAPDQKSALELQAAIGVEQGLLQNEQTKLQILRQAAHSEQRADDERERESIVAGHGSFAGRFEPSPP
jgi:type IV secretion system protein VirB5